MTAKSRGTSAEHRAIADLERAGYHVTRSSASLGALDVVAIGPTGVRGVQVKLDSPGRTLRPSELETVREELRALPRPAVVTYEIWVSRLVSRRYQWIRQEVVCCN